MKPSAPEVPIATDMAERLAFGAAARNGIWRLKISTLQPVVQVKRDPRGIQAKHMRQDQPGVAVRPFEPSFGELARQLLEAALDRLGAAQLPSSASLRA